MAYGIGSSSGVANLSQYNLSINPKNQTLVGENIKGMGNSDASFKTVETITQARQQARVDTIANILKNLAPLIKSVSSGDTTQHVEVRVGGSGESKPAAFSAETKTQISEGLNKLPTATNYLGGKIQDSFETFMSDLKSDPKSSSAADKFAGIYHAGGDGISAKKNVQDFLLMYKETKDNLQTSQAADKDAKLAKLETLKNDFVKIVNKCGLGFNSAVNNSPLKSIVDYNKFNKMCQSMAGLASSTSAAQRSPLTLKGGLGAEINKALAGVTDTASRAKILSSANELLFRNSVNEHETINNSLNNDSGSLPLDSFTALATRLRNETNILDLLKEDGPELLAGPDGPADKAGPAGNGPVININIDDHSDNRIYFGNNNETLVPQDLQSVASTVSNGTDPLEGDAEVVEQGLEAPADEPEMMDQDIGQPAQELHTSKYEGPEKNTNTNDEVDGPTQEPDADLLADTNPLDEQGPLNTLSAQPDNTVVGQKKPESLDTGNSVSGQGDEPHNADNPVGNAGTGTADQRDVASGTGRVDEGRGFQGGPGSAQARDPLNNRGMGAQGPKGPHGLNSAGSQYAGIPSSAKSPDQGKGTQTNNVGGRNTPASQGQNGGAGQPEAGNGTGRVDQGRGFQGGPGSAQARDPLNSGGMGAQGPKGPHGLNSAGSQYAGIPSSAKNPDQGKGTQTNDVGGRNTPASQGQNGGAGQPEAGNGTGRVDEGRGFQGGPGSAQARDPLNNRGMGAQGPKGPHGLNSAGSQYAGIPSSAKSPDQGKGTQTNNVGGRNTPASQGQNGGAGQPEAGNGTGRVDEGRGFQGGPGSAQARDPLNSGGMGAQGPKGPHGLNSAGSQHAGIPSSAKSPGQGKGTQTNNVGGRNTPASQGQNGGAGQPEAGNGTGRVDQGRGFQGGPGSAQARDPLNSGGMGAQGPKGPHGLNSAGSQYAGIPSSAKSPGQGKGTQTNNVRESRAQQMGVAFEERNVGQLNGHAAMSASASVVANEGLHSEVVANVADHSVKVNKVSVGQASNVSGNRAQQAAAAFDKQNIGQPASRAAASAVVSEKLHSGVVASSAGQPAQPAQFSKPLAKEPVGRSTLSGQPSRGDAFRGGPGSAQGIDPLNGRRMGAQGPKGPHGLNSAGSSYAGISSSVQGGGQNVGRNAGTPSDNKGPVTTPQGGVKGNAGQPGQSVGQGRPFQGSLGSAQGIDPLNGRRMGAQGPKGPHGLNSAGSSYAGISSSVQGGGQNVGRNAGTPSDNKGPVTTPQGGVKGNAGQPGQSVGQGRPFQGSLGSAQSRDPLNGGRMGAQSPKGPHGLNSAGSSYAGISSSVQGGGQNVGRNAGTPSDNKGPVTTPQGGVKGNAGQPGQSVGQGRPFQGSLGSAQSRDPLNGGRMGAQGPKSTHGLNSHGSAYAGMPQSELKGKSGNKTD